MTLSMFNRPEYIWNTARCTLSNDISSKRELWAHKTSLTPPLFTEVTVPSQESELSCVSVLGFSILPFLRFFYWILELFSVKPCALSVTISAWKRCSVRLYLRLFVGGRMSYLRYLRWSVFPHILCCVLVLFFFDLCIICCQFLWIVQFWLPLLYSLTFINLLS